MIKRDEISKHRYCGARVWVDHSLSGTLRDRIFQYWGTAELNNEVYHKFAPHKRKGTCYLLTDHQIGINLSSFKPFMMDMEELEIYKEG